MATLDQRMAKLNARLKHPISVKVLEKMMCGYKIDFINYISRDGIVNTDKLMDDFGSYVQPTAIHLAMAYIEGMIDPNNMSTIDAAARKLGYDPGDMGVAIFKTMLQGNRHSATHIVNDSGRIITAEVYIKGSSLGSRKIAIRSFTRFDYIYGDVPTVEIKQDGKTKIRQEIKSDRSVIYNGRLVLSKYGDIWKPE